MTRVLDDLVVNSLDNEPASELVIPLNVTIGGVPFGRVPINWNGES